MMPLLKAYN